MRRWLMRRSGRLPSLRGLPRTVVPDAERHRCCRLGSKDVVYLLIGLNAGIVGDVLETQQPRLRAGAAAAARIAIVYFKAPDDAFQALCWDSATDRPVLQMPG